VPIPQRKRITHDFMVTGEGPADQEFFRQLCINRGIQGYQFESFDGLGKLDDWLVGLANSSDISKLKLLFVVADSDESPGNRFLEIRKALKKAKLPQPNNAFELATPPNQPAVMVILLPFTPPGTANKGCIETLLLQSALSHLAQFADCVTQYCACVKSETWKLTSHVDKLRMRVLLAGASEDDPNLGLQYALNPARNLIPMGNACFDALAALLRDAPGRL
jgi:hypothetical protein